MMVRPLLTLKDIQEYVLAIEEYDGVVPNANERYCLFELRWKTLTS